jgi:hypothetical protein
MIQRKTDQFQHENNTWLRALDFLRHENTVLKNRLADIIKQKVDKDLLERAEAFLTAFLNKDAVFALLRSDIKEQEKALQQAASLQNGFDQKLAAKQKKLREDMQKMEFEFSRLKSGFNDYLSEVL